MKLDLQAIRNRLQSHKTTDYSILFSYLQKYLDYSIDNTRELLSPIIRGDYTKGVVSLRAHNKQKYIMDLAESMNNADYAFWYPEYAWFEWCGICDVYTLFEEDELKYVRRDNSSVVVVCDSAYTECIEACARTTCQLDDMYVDIIIFYRREEGEDTGVPVAYTVFKSNNGHSEALASAEPFSDEWKLAYVMQHYNG